MAEPIITICFPVLTAVKKARHHCPNCKKRRTFVMWFEDWYGWTAVCLGCGDRWQDGEMCPRPYFCGPWRQEAIRHAKEQWKVLSGTIPAMPPRPNVVAEIHSTDKASYT